jgi:hypothetical protein
MHTEFWCGNVKERRHYQALDIEERMIRIKMEKKKHPMGKALVYYFGSG